MERVAGAACPERPAQRAAVAVVVAAGAKCRPAKMAMVERAAALAGMRRLSITQPTVPDRSSTSISLAMFGLIRAQPFSPSLRQGKREGRLAHRLVPPNFPAAMAGLATTPPLGAEVEGAVARVARTARVTPGPTGRVCRAELGQPRTRTTHRLAQTAHNSTQRMV